MDMTFHDLVLMTLIHTRDDSGCYLESLLSDCGTGEHELVAGVAVADGHEG